LTNNNYISLLPGSILSGVSIYFVLSYLFVPIGITAASAISISVLVFGLSRSFTLDNRATDRPQNRVNNELHQKDRRVNTSLPLSVSNIILVIIYLITLIITGFFSRPNADLFVPWNQFTATQILQLASSILLSFFLPGYIIVNVLDKKKHELQPILKVLLAYIFSIAIVGFGGYLAASFEVPISEIKAELIAIYVAILIVFIGTNSIRTSQSEIRAYFERVKISINKNSTEFLVFGTLFALVVLSTYTLYQGVIIGDQWFHHGRILSFIGGAYKSEAVDSFYPSYFHAVLGSFFSLSGVPSVNAYVSINFLNIMPILAFYYFFCKWVPSRNPNWKRAALLACAFFILSSGFGWIDVITMGKTTNPIYSQLSALEVFHLVETKTLDIRKAGDFVITGSPAPTTGLILIALPAGFLLLGLIREKLNCKVKYLAILALISTVGILSHDEFYLFVIICPFIPLIFRFSERKNSLYLALLSSFFVVFLIDIISPEKYYTSRQVFAAPFIVLSALFVGFMWALYASRIFHRVSLAIKLRSKVPNLSRLKIYLGIVIFGVFAYLYLLTFLVWGQLSAEDVQIQQYPSALPWYLFPMKLGVTGLLGFAFLISYLFKRYEREVYILGLIALIALVLGPYYDEYRFSKYIMVAMGGFASLLIYKIVSAIKRTRLKPLITGLIIGLVISSSSLSALMFMGYTASALQYPDFEEFHKHSKRRIFPSPQDIQFFSTLRKDTINLKTDYVTVPAEYRGPDSKLEQFENQTLSKKIEAFLGTSVASPPKFFKSPFTLNATSLTGFYYLLNFTNTHYIILPKENIINQKLQQPVQFALDNFPKAYEDSNYIVLTVPSIVAPISSVNSVALINQQEGMFLSSLVSGEKLLRFNNNSKTLMPSEDVKTTQKQDETLRIFNGAKRSTIWSNLPQQKDVNYIEGKFRVVGQNDSKVGTSGIVWQSQDKEYRVSLKEKGLQLSEKRPSNDKEMLLSENAGVKKEGSKWYTLKVLTLGNTIATYLDDVLKLQVRTDSSHNFDITKVGIRVDKNTAEFEPIKLGHISQSQPSNMSYNRGIYYHYYYPINELALSKTAYNTFVDGDKSAFSHKTIMLPWDPSYSDTNFKDYLHFVNDGGRLVVINTGGNFDGGFSKLLNVTAGITTKFDGIEGPGDGASNAIAVSGSARTIDLNSNATAISYYMHNGKKVAAFALESKIGSAGGQIIFVNSNGYYDALFKSPERFFMTLGRIPSILGLNFANYTKEVLPDNVTTGARFVGDLRISGPSHTVITSPSLLLPNVNPYTVDDISTSNSSIPINGIDKKNNNLNKNVLIENLTFSGSYRATIESTGVVSMPSSVYQYDYIGVSLPKRVDLTLKLLDKSGRAEFIIAGSNATGKYNLPISIGNMEEIRFHNIGLQDSSTDNQTIIMKSPEINATGNITVNNFYTPARGESDINLKQLNASVHHSDNYVTNYKNASRMQFVTYLNWIQTKGISEHKQIAIKLPLPGDISERAKKKGVEVPWEDVMVSTNGIILLLSVVSVTAIALWRSERLGPNMK
jgi:hypothetical protein